MLDLEQLQILAQLVDNMEIITENIEKSFEENNGEEFTKAKKELLDSQTKINEIIIKQ